jgi:hypothetical protein
MITLIAIEVVELAQLDHLSWQGPLGLSVRTELGKTDMTGKVHKVREQRL